MTSAPVLVCGAGIAGVSTAYELAARRGIRGIVLVDQGPPLGLTSAVGTEAYRDFWPGPDDTMIRFVGRSIDLLEELVEASGDAFRMTRRGYAFLTAEASRLARLEEAAARMDELGAGPVRRHPGSEPWRLAELAAVDRNLRGVDLVLDGDAVRRAFPFVAPGVRGLLHARRCGWLDARALGRWLLVEAERRGVTVRRDRVVGFELSGGRVVAARLEAGGRVATGAVVLAAGPLLRETGAMLGLDLPVTNELHGKLALPDPLDVVPRDAPMLLWMDPVRLAWSEPERSELAADPAGRPLLDTLPPGVHVRPRDRDGERTILVIWTREPRVEPPRWPPRFDAREGEVLLRALTAMIPGLAAYHGQAHRGVIDGGYYCKTRENRPLIGPLPVAGAFVIGALSGFGVMASQAAAELVAAHVTGANLPSYAAEFLPERYASAAYRARLPELERESGQL